MKSPWFVVVLAGAALLGSVPLPAQTSTDLQEQVRSVEVRPGVTLKYLAVTGASEPAAVVLLMAGGNGAIKLGDDGSINALKGNFLLRTRKRFAREGLFVAVLDLPSDHPDGVSPTYRLSQEHAADIAKVMTDIRARTPAPIWIVGTSMGTMSAVGVAARLAARKSDLHGIVLTSTITQTTARVDATVYDAKLRSITAPTLVASHQDDGCPATPGTKAAGQRLLAALGAAAKELKVFDGGDPPISGPCQARAQHGFLGIEAAVIKEIADWIKAH
jgi:pimeloyl-ACP methyl ester carboxylesterase